MVVSLISFVLLILDCKSESFKFHKDNIINFFEPIKKNLNLPFKNVEVISEYLSFKEKLILEKSKLTAKNLQNEVKLQRLKLLEAENIRLRQLLEYKLKSKDEFVLAGIVRIGLDPFTKLISLDSGLENGVKKGQFVVDENGIIGTIVSSRDKISKLMLITDASHAIPVENIRNGERSIATGASGSKLLVLQHVPKSMDYKEGDIVVSSGLGGRFIAGYRVGEVVMVKNDDSKSFTTIYIKPFSILDKNKYVLIVK